MMTPDIHEQIGRVRDFAEDKASVAASVAVEKLKDATDALKDAREGAVEVYAKSKEKAGAAYNDARDTSYKVATRANILVQEHPIAATAAAAAAGAMIALIFPKGRAVVKAAPGLFATLRNRAAQATSAAATIIEHSSESARTSAARVADEARAVIDATGTKASGLADAAAALAKDAVDAAGKAADKLRK